MDVRALALAKQILIFEGSWIPALQSPSFDQLYENIDLLSEISGSESKFSMKEQTICMVL